MNANQKLARITGLLFIIGTAAGLFSLSVLGSINDPVLEYGSGGMANLERIQSDGI